jgi:hypothetical protein
MTRRWLFVTLLLVLPATAFAQDSAGPAKCFSDPGRWAFDRTKETIAKAGERFFEDMRKCDPTFAAAVTEAVRYEIHKDETEKFTRSSKYVMAAYGVAWAILAISGLLLWLRQRRLNDEIGALEAKLRDAEAQGK